MVKSTELRIGNIIEVPERMASVVGKKQLPIAFFYKEGVALDSEGINKASYDLINHIPLTAEWLVKFGFEKRPGREGYYWHKKLSNSKMFKQHFRIGEAGMYFIPFGIDDYQSAEINFVHSLQNVYFALTGEELTLK